MTEQVTKKEYHFIEGPYSTGISFEDAMEKAKLRSLDYVASSGDNSFLICKAIARVTVPKTLTIPAAVEAILA